MNMMQDKSLILEDGRRQILYNMYVNYTVSLHGRLVMGVGHIRLVKTVECGRSWAATGVYSRTRQMSSE